MLAYRIPGVEAADAADLMRRGTDPRLNRLRGAGPWRYAKHPEGGTLAVPREIETPPPIESLGDGIVCADGLVYYRPKPIPTLIDVAKSIRSEWETDVALVCGLSLTIAMAVAEPLKARFSGRSSEPATEYGQLMRHVARLIDEQTDEAPVTDEHPDVKRLVVLAIQQRYRVTAELIDDMDFLTTDDIQPILAAANATTKKAPAAATGT